MGIIAWIVLGAIAGFITNLIMGGGEGVILTVILGIVGSGSTRAAGSRLPAAPSGACAQGRSASRHDAPVEPQPNPCLIIPGNYI